MGNCYVQNHGVKSCFVPGEMVKTHCSKLLKLDTTQFAETMSPMPLY